MHTRVRPSMLTPVLLGTLSAAVGCVRGNPDAAYYDGDPADIDTCDIGSYGGPGADDW